MVFPGRSLPRTVMGLALAGRLGFAPVSPDSDSTALRLFHLKLLPLIQPPSPVVLPAVFTC